MVDPERMLGRCDIVSHRGADGTDRLPAGACRGVRGILSALQYKKRCEVTSRDQSLTRPAMGRIWELENKFEIWKEIEVLACEAQAELGQAGITKEEARWIRDHACFTVAEIDEIEKVTHHDVIAFTTCMAGYIDADVPDGEEKPSRWVHYGMTSSDLGDTALSYQITQAIDIILADIKELGETCRRRAFEFEDVLCVGRTHGIHAEPMTFGMKFGSWAWALKRAQTRMEQAREVAATGAISGAVGTYSSIDPYVEQYVCEKMGLTPDPLSTQVLARDRHAQVMWRLLRSLRRLSSPSRCRPLAPAVRCHRSRGAVREGAERVLGHAA